MGQTTVSVYDNKQFQVSKALAKDTGYGQIGSSAAAMCLCKHNSQEPRGGHRSVLDRAEGAHTLAYVRPYQAPATHWQLYEEGPSAGLWGRPDDGSEGQQRVGSVQGCSVLT